MSKRTKWILGALGALLGYVLLYAVCESVPVVDIDRIIAIESGGDKNAYNAGSGARGLMQITPICLREWNKRHLRDQYTLDDLYNGEINIRIGTWYITSRIPQMLAYYQIPDTTTARLACYNFGIGNYRKYLLGQKQLPNETKQYIVKYNRGRK